MALTASLVGSRGTTGGNSVTTGAGTSAAAATFAALVSYDATAGSITSVGDNKGNTYTAIGTPQTDNAGGLLRWYVCENGVGGAGHTFTFTTANANFATAHLIQITSDAGGIARRDINVQGTDTDQPWSALATGTLNYSTELILGGVGGNGGGGTANYTSGNGTIVSQEPNVNNYWTSAVSSHSVSSTASYSPSFSKSDAGGATDAGLSHVTFYEEAGSGSTPTAAAGASTAGSLAGSGAASSTATAAAGTSTAGALTGSGGSGSTPGAAAGTSTTSTRAGSATATATATSAAGASTAGSLAGSGGSGSAALTAAGGSSGGTLAGSATAAADTGPRPLLGNHSLVGQEEGSGTDPVTSDPIDTAASGSSLIAFVAGYTSNTGAPTDNYGNTWTHAGTEVYRDYSGVFNVRGYYAAQAAGGAGHTVTFQKDANPAGEATVPVVEVRNGGRVRFERNYPADGASVTSPSITVQGPATLVAFWWGDAAGLFHNATPSTGWTVIEAFGTLPPNSAVQCFVAVRQVTAPGSYACTWSHSPSQGAPLWIFAIESDDAGAQAAGTGGTLAGSGSIGSTPTAAAGASTGAVRAGASTAAAAPTAAAGASAGGTLAGAGVASGSGNPVAAAGAATSAPLAGASTATTAATPAPGSGAGGTLAGQGNVGPDAADPTPASGTSTAQLLSGSSAAAAAAQPAAGASTGAAMSPPPPDVTPGLATVSVVSLTNARVSVK